MACPPKAFTVDLDTMYDQHKARKCGPNAPQNQTPQPQRERCEAIADCHRERQVIDSQIAKLRHLKRTCDQRAHGWEDNMYLLDPTEEPRMGFEPNMYRIDLGSRDCELPFGPNSAQHLINPNKDFRFRPDEERWMLTPGTTELIRKDQHQQRKQLRIYPHMFMNYEQLQRDADAPHPPYSPGGVPYPIPMRRNLRYLQQAKPETPLYQGLDHDVEVHAAKHGICGRPEGRETIRTAAPDSSYTVRPDYSQYNDLRLTELAKDPRGYTNPVQQAIVQKELEADWETLQSGSNAYLDGIRDKARSIGVYDPSPETVARRVARRNATQAGDITLQPLDWYRYKSVPNAVEPQFVRTTDQTDGLKGQIFNAGGHRVSSPTAQPQAPAYPGPAAMKSSFFELGPPLPPPSPQLLSSVPSRILLQRSPVEARQLPTIDKPVSQIETFDGSTNVSEISGQDQALAKLMGIEKGMESLLIRIGWLRVLIPMLRQADLDAKLASHIAAFFDAQHRLSEALSFMRRMEESLAYLRAEHQKVLKALENDENLLRHADRRIKDLENRINKHFAMPGAAVVWAYQGNEFEGEPVVLNYGMHDHPNVGGVGNNRLRSLKIPAGTEVVLYEHANKRGVRLTYRGPRLVRLLPRKYRDAISGIEVRRMYGGGEVGLFDGNYYQGSTATVGPGMHDYPDVGGVGNRSLSSMIIPRGLAVTLYSRPQRQGNQITFTGPKRVPILPSGWRQEVAGVEVTEAPLVDTDREPT